MIPMPTRTARAAKLRRQVKVTLYLAATAAACSTAQMLLDGNVHRWVWGG